MKSLLRDFYRRIKFYNSTPLNRKHDDVFLVEFPKSGVTWMSFILANIIQKLSGIPGNINFFNFTQYVPDINYSLNIGTAKNALGFRIIKSHSKYNPFYIHVILLIRNPFNVMLSYYKYLSALNVINMDFSKFLRSKKFGLETWVSHTESWLRKSKGGHRLQIVRYEDLSRDTFKTTESIFKILGVEIDEKILKDSVELSSFSEMKNLDKIYAENNPNYKLNFVRKGGTGTSEINIEDFNYILNNTKNLIPELWSDIDFKKVILTQ